MEDLRYIEIVTWNRKMMLMYGDKLTGTQRAIGWRSNGLHTEIRFSDRYGRISFSCTLADSVGGCRFKMIEYLHPYRQNRVRIPVTAEQEARLFAKACELADVDVSITEFWVNHADHQSGYFDYGPNHIKYDKWGARIAFITKLNWWKMHRFKMICNEAVAVDMLEVWPDLLRVNGIDIDPATLTPDQFEYMVRHYFSKETR